jgi:ribosome recycling factor
MANHSILLNRTLFDQIKSKLCFDKGVNQMSEQQKPENDLRDEFRNLGENLKQMFNSAWESEERQKLQQDIKDGMKEIGVALDDLAEDVRSSEMGENIRREANEFGERVRSGEVEEKARQGIRDALQALNTELQKVTDKFSSTVEGQAEDVPETSEDDPSV